MSVSGGGAVQTRINGIKVTDKEIAAVRAKDVLRVEFIEDPGKQYGDDELGAVVNIILRRRETGGVVNFQLSDSPHTLWGENFLSAKFNYKNSEWGIDYFNKNGKYHSRLESHETFYLGDRTIDRIKEGHRRRVSLPELHQQPESDVQSDESGQICIQCHLP